MSPGERIIAAFDFDGTITRKDTLLEFIRFTHGTGALYRGFLLHLPVLIAFKLKLYSNGRAKEKIFSYFFKGMEYGEFCKWGEQFAEKIESLVRQSAKEEIMNCQQENQTLYIVTASIREWVLPWALKTGFRQVIGTEVEIDPSGKLTGKFSTPNCYGPEKVKRLLDEEPYRNSYIVYAYGDSRGDKELLNFADYGHYKKFKD